MTLWDNQKFIENYSGIHHIANALTLIIIIILIIIFYVQSVAAISYDLTYIYA